MCIYHEYPRVLCLARMLGVSTLSPSVRPSVFEWLHVYGIVPAPACLHLCLYLCCPSTHFCRFSLALCLNLSVCLCLLCLSVCLFACLFIISVSIYLRIAVLLVVAWLCISLFLICCFVMCVCVSFIPKSTHKYTQRYMFGCAIFDVSCCFLSCILL